MKITGTKMHEKPEGISRKIMKIMKITKATKTTKTMKTMKIMKTTKIMKITKTAKKNITRHENKEIETHTRRKPYVIKKSIPQSVMPGM